MDHPDAMRANPFAPARPGHHISWVAPPSFAPKQFVFARIPMDYAFAFRTADSSSRHQNT
jgi:hypothetical protein